LFDVVLFGPDFCHQGFGNLAYASDLFAFGDSFSTSLLYSSGVLLLLISSLLPLLSFILFIQFIPLLAKRLVPS
jgi:hypothetical protein